MQMKMRKSFILLFSAIIAALLLACAFMLAPKTTASADEEETHAHSTMTELSTYADIENGELTEGEYVLTGDIEGNISVSGTVTLCLNGHTITGDGTGSVISVNVGAAFTLCDCNEECGKITGGTGNEAGLLYKTGGGVYVKDDAKIIMTGGTISGNTAEDGGGVYLENDGGTFKMTGGIISGNGAASQGGGVLVGAYSGTAFAMDGGTISGNTADVGGGVCVSVSAEFTMTDGEISGNAAEDFGGGVRVELNAVFTMTGGEIKSNTAGTAAGVNIAGGLFTMSGGAISGNTAEGTIGGVDVGYADFTDDGGTFKMTGGEISGNTALIGGGVVVDSYSTFIMENGTISGNTGEYGTGGVILGNGTFKMSGGRISGNAQNQDMGMGFCGGLSLGYAMFTNPEDGEISFEISGAPDITGNTGNNVVVSDYCKITVTGELTEGTKVGVTVDGESDVVATGFMQGDKASKYFIPDNPENCAYVSDEASGTVTIGTHDIVLHEAKQPACTESGWQAYDGCSRCDYSIDKVAIPALGHNYGEWTVTKEATESEEGEECRICANDEMHYETRTIPKLTPNTPTPEEETKSYWWLFWLLIPLAIGVGGVTLGIWVYKNDK